MRRAVGLVAEGEDLVWMTPAEGDGQRWEILKSLALVNRGDRPLAEVLSRVGNSLGRNASLVIITPSTDTAWVEALVPLVRQGAVPTVMLLDPDSFGESEVLSGFDTFGGAHAMDAVEIGLQNLGITYYKLDKDVLNRPEARPGRQGQWEWRVSGTGKAIAIKRDESQPVEWRTLA